MMQFFIPGPPIGKERARATMRGGKIHHYTGKKTRDYETWVRLSALYGIPWGEPYTAPVSVTIEAIFQIPKSYSKYKMQCCLSGELKCVQKPDLDNITKTILDGMNGVIFLDDKQVISCMATKRYVDAKDEIPGVLVRVEVCK